MQLAEQRRCQKIRSSRNLVLQRASRWKIEDVIATILSDIDSDTDEEKVATDDEPIAADNTN